MARKIHLALCLFLAATAAVSASLWADGILRAKRNYQLVEIGKDWPAKGEFYLSIRCYGGNLFALAGRGEDPDVRNVIKAPRMRSTYAHSPFQQVKDVRNWIFETAARSAAGPARRHGSLTMGKLNCYVAALPAWLIACVAAPYPVLVFTIPRLRRFHRRRNGLCEQCAYDLRGSRHSPLCPECGMIVDSPARTI